MSGRTRLHRLGSANALLKKEVRRTLAQSYFRTDLVQSPRQSGVEKYKASYNHVIQLYNKMQPTLVRPELRPYLFQLGHIEVPKTVLSGRVKRFHGDEEEEEDTLAPQTQRVVSQDEEEEKAPTLDQL